MPLAAASLHPQRIREPYFRAVRARLLLLKITALAGDPHTLRPEVCSLEETPPKELASTLDWDQANTSQTID